MPSYKLTYFDARGRAEVARFLFAQAEVEYEDVRVKGEDFPQLKPKLLTGTMPELEVDGVILSGSGPINRFLAETLGDYSGKNAVERAKIGGIMDIVDDLFGKVISAVYADPLVKESVEKKLVEEHIPNYMNILEKMISTNKFSYGWSYGSEVSCADMTIAVIIDGYIFSKDPSLKDKYPLVAKCIDAVHSLPKIAQWIKSRPPSKF